MLITCLGIQGADLSPEVSRNTKVIILLEVDILAPGDDIGYFYFLFAQAKMEVGHGFQGEAFLQDIVPQARRKSKLIELVIQIICLNGDVLPLVIKGIHRAESADRKALVVKIKLKRTVKAGGIPVT